MTGATNSASADHLLRPRIHDSISDSNGSRPKRAATAVLFSQSHSSNSNTTAATNSRQLARLRRNAVARAISSLGGSKLDLRPLAAPKDRETKAIDASAHKPVRPQPASKRQTRLPMEQLRGSAPTDQGHDNEHDEKQSETAAGVVSPPLAVRPRGQGAEQQQNHDDQQ